MTRLSRRRTLRATGLGIGLLCAGCLRGSGGDGDGGTGSVGVNGTDALQLGPRNGTPGWAEGDAAGTARLFSGPDAARSALNFEPYDRPSEDIQGYLDQADHEAIQLVYVETVGPNTCFTEVTPSEFAVSDGSLAGTLAATKSSETPDDGACGQAVTYPAALVQVLYSGRPPDNGSLTVVNGSGEETAVDVSVDGES